MTALLETRDLCVRFGKGSHTVDAVSNVSFSLEQGHTLGIVGESGSGKTTLVLAAAGLCAISAGSVLFDGRDIAQFDRSALREFRRSVQLIFQDPLGSMNPSFSVNRVLDDPQRVLAPQRGRAERLARSRELLELVGLPGDILSRRPRDLSGGQCQRLAIARALAFQPRLVVCDECTSALDVSVQAQILNLLRELQNKFNTSYLFVTHDMGVVSYMADDILVMHEGHVVQQGAASWVLSSSRQPYTRALIDAAGGRIPS